VSAAAQALQEGTARTLRAVAFAMCNAVLALVALAVFFHFRSASLVPDPGMVKLVNGMTMLAMGLACAAIVLSEIVWKKMLAGATAADANRKVVSAYAVRAALREGAALLGCAALFVAAHSGVLRAYPSYWVDLAPAGLFISFLYAHWPSLARLKAELADAP
jgi:hypothetical protein